MALTCRWRVAAVIKSAMRKAAPAARVPVIAAAGRRHGRQLMIDIGVYGAYFDPELSFSFCITSSILKLAAFWRCG
jgi:hypothetical protein